MSIETFIQEIENRKRKEIDGLAKDLSWFMGRVGKQTRLTNRDFLKTKI